MKKHEHWQKDMVMEEALQEALAHEMAPLTDALPDEKTLANRVLGAAETNAAPKANKKKTKVGRWVGIGLPALACLLVLSLVGGQFLGFGTLLGAGDMEGSVVGKPQLVGPEKDSVDSDLADSKDGYGIGPFESETLAPPEGIAPDGEGYDDYLSTEKAPDGTTLAPSDSDVLGFDPSVLTAARQNDNNKFADWQKLLEEGGAFEAAPQFRWKLTVYHRITLHLQTPEGKAVANADIALLDKDGVLFSAKTNNKGVAYLFWNIFRTGKEDSPLTVVISKGDAKTEISLTQDQRKQSDLALEAVLSAQNSQKSLDFFLALDTTGSMGDEMNYLAATLEDVLNRVKNENGNLSVRFGLNFYRDENDDYLVKSHIFTENIKTLCDLIGQETAAGGGDTPEAVHSALADALEKHEWRQDSTKILLLVLDAPPHDDSQTVEEMHRLTRLAAEKGVRIVPVLCSGGDKNTEYLLRSMALLTGGEYVFLTDHSGVGGSHMEADVSDYQVEKLNDLLVSLIGGYLQD